MESNRWTRSLARGVAASCLVLTLACGQARRTAPTGAARLSVADFTIRPASWTGAPPFTLSQHLDHPTLLYFMASWCIDCIPEAKALALLQQEFGDQVTLIAIDMDPNDNEAGLLRFKRAAKGADHLWALDDDRKLSQAYHVVNLDTTIIISPQGRETYRAFGPRGRDALKAALVAAGAPAQVQETPASSGGAGRTP
jgi:thiol-disulfide isomerase/thioredoxin